MPIIPPDPRFSASQSYQARDIAESFGTDAGRYDRTRPRYPRPMVEAILARSRGREVLDVGIGTGISARAFRQEGCRVVGVDPDERMAEFARADGFEVDVATFEDWDPAGRSFDLVVAGQTWHWVDPVLGAAKAAEVLRPCGRVALFWNVMLLQHEFAQAFSAVYRRVVPGFPFFQNGAPAGLDSYAPLLEKAVDGLRATGRFAESEQWRFEWERTYATEEWLEVVPTFGGHSQIPAEQREELLAGIGEVLNSAGGGFTMGYTAVVVTAQLLDAA